MSDKEERLFWTGTEKLSGHSAIMIAEIPAKDRSSLNKPDQKEWVMMGQRADGVIDIAHVRGPEGVMGVSKPSEGDKIAQQVAAGFGRAALGKDARPGFVNKLIARASNPVARDTAVQTEGYSILPVRTNAQQQRLVAHFSDDQAHAFGALLIGNIHTQGKVMTGSDRLRSGDVRAPGAIAALNRLNGVVNAAGKDKDTALAWTGEIIQRPGTMFVMEMALSNPRNEMSDKFVEPNSLGLAQLALKGDKVAEEHPRMTARMMELMTYSNVSREDKTTLVEVLPVLAQRDREAPAAWSRDDMPALAAAARLLKDLDGPVGTQDATENTLRLASQRVLRDVGAKAVDMESEIGSNSLSRVAEFMEQAYITPITQNAAKDGNVLNGKETEAKRHAVLSIVGLLPLDQIPQQVVLVDKATIGNLPDTGKLPSLDHGLRNLSPVLFPNMEKEQKGDLQRALVVPSVQRAVQAKTRAATASQSADRFDD